MSDLLIYKKAREIGSDFCLRLGDIYMEHIKLKYTPEEIIYINEEPTENSFSGATLAVMSHIIKTNTDLQRDIGLFKKHYPSKALYLDDLLYCIATQVVELPEEGYFE